MTLWDTVRGWWEARAHPSDPNIERYLLGNVSGSASGVEVTEDSALSATAVWAGVRIISETVAMLPLKLYERLDERSKRPARNNPLFKLLHDEPNPEQTSFEFREMQQGFLLLWGNCYAQKITNGRGEVIELWPLVPWRVTPQRTPSNTLVYRVKLPGDGGGEAVLPADDVMHLRGFSSNGLLGDNVVQRFRESIGLGLAAERSGARFYGNGYQLAGFLKHPGKLGPDGRKNLRESWKENHGGVDRHHRLGILEEGIEFIATSTDPQKAQALETRKFQVTEVARILNLPPHLLKDLERATFTNIEHQGQEYVTYSIQPWLTRWEQRMNRSLLLPNQRKNLFTKFEVGALLRGDSAARSAFYKSMFETGVYSINDIREKEDDEPVEGGDQRFVPMNMVPLEKVGEITDAQIKAKETPPPAPVAEPEAEEEEAPEPRAIRPDPRAAMEPVVRAELDRAVRRQVKAVRAALKKDAQEFRIWADGFFEKERGLVESSLQPAMDSLSALTGDEFDTKAFAGLDSAKALDDFRRALGTPEEYEARIEAVLTKWETERVDTLTKQIIERPALPRAA
jgi:HK97 family phage portal protein